jgi:diguanylate cyclase (GGDEF)-like protein
MGATLKTFLVPGGILLFGVALLANTGWITLAPPALSFLYYCALAGGMLLAWRFHSSRIFFALLVLFLGQQVTVFGGSVHSGPGTSEWTVLQAIAVLIPLNFVAIALMSERGFTLSGTAPVGLFLFVQTVIVAVLSRASERVPLTPVHAHRAAMAGTWSGPMWFALIAAGLFLLLRSFFTHKPVDGALFWSLCASSLSIYFMGSTRVSMMYAATSCAILAASIVETSYLLAYQDELTSLPSRRAFNEAALRLQDPYAIAVVDIDHFKRFNDTYGHETGDQVLRLVAGKLSRVTGGGQAYRCGGEEFTILFPGKGVQDVIEHLEELRESIEVAEFRFRNDDRRQVTRGPDRRNPERSGKSIRKRARTGDAIRQLAQRKPAGAVAVTVSIGVAASTLEKPYYDVVLEAADKALYQAKNNGRNRIETASVVRKRKTKAAGIA